MTDSAMFTPFTINNVEFKNRILRSSVGGRMSNYDATVTDVWKNFEKRFADGGISGIISTTFHVNKDRVSPLQYPSIAGISCGLKSQTSVGFTLMPGKSSRSKRTIKTHPARGGFPRGVEAKAIVSLLFLAKETDVRGGLGLNPSLRMKSRFASAGAVEADCIVILQLITKQEIAALLGRPDKLKFLDLIATSCLPHHHLSPGHHIDGGSLAEILVGRSATRWLRL